MATKEISRAREIRVYLDNEWLTSRGIVIHVDEETGQPYLSIHTRAGGTQMFTDEWRHMLVTMLGEDRAIELEARHLGEYGLAAISRCPHD